MSLVLTLWMHLGVSAPALSESDTVELQVSWSELAPHVSFEEGPAASGALVGLLDGLESSFDGVPIVVVDPFTEQVLVQLSGSF